MEIRRNAGFTIIELVVVIVVIGILAAVALPRFLSLQDRAHDAVVEGTQAALASGVVMAKAVWLAEGRDSALDDILEKDIAETCVGGTTDTSGNVDCDPIVAATATTATPPVTVPVSLDANRKGYPVSHTQYNTAAIGNPISTSSVNNAISPAACTEVFEFLLSESSVKATDTDETGLGGGADSAFEFYTTAVGPNTCQYAYLPDIADNQTARRTITYTPDNGRVTVSNLSDAGTTSD